MAQAVATLRAAASIPNVCRPSDQSAQCSGRFAVARPRADLRSQFLGRGERSGIGASTSLATGSVTNGSKVAMAWGGALAATRLITQGRNLELTEPIKQYIEEKVGKAVVNHVPIVREVDVRLSTRGGDHGKGDIHKGKKVHRTEVTVFTKKHGIVRAEEEGETMYASIDLVSDMVERKLRKIKEKDGGRGRTWQMTHGKQVDDLLPTDVVTKTEIPVAVEETRMPDEVVRVKYFSMEPMEVEDALEQLLKVGHDFYAFRNTRSGEINIIYKRNHGGYGLIVPRTESQWEGTGNGTV